MQSDPVAHHCVHEACSLNQVGHFEAQVWNWPLLTVRLAEKIWTSARSSLLFLENKMSNNSL